MKAEMILFLSFVINILFAQQLSSQSVVWSPDNQNGTFTNPIRADWPDPDVIRVGDNFYMISTSMHYVPGCPIAISKDLVNWEIAGYAVDRSYPPNGLHQGGMVQLKNGDWWFIIVQDRGPIERVPHLIPVEWVDGWLMLGIGGKDVITYYKPDIGKKYPVKSPATSDEFNDSILGLQWQWNHNPDNSKWSLKERKGYMRLRASQAESLKTAKNALIQHVQGPCSEGAVELDITGLEDGNTA